MIDENLQFDRHVTTPLEVDYPIGLLDTGGSNPP